jgi:RES domain-containing protein
MYCCSNCFGHYWLKGYVNKHSKETGTCDFCESEDVPVLSTDALAGHFHNMLSMYVVAETYESGESLLSLIQWNWQVFDDDLNEDKQGALLEEIANSNWDDDDGEPMLDATELYMPKSSQWFHNSHSDAWEQFCSDVRRDPQIPIPLDEFIAEELAESEENLSAGMTFSRARLGFKLDENDERLPWAGTEIGAPPTGNASAGRANAAGQVVLYVADEEKTALSEVRPALGFYVSVANLILKRHSRILDLTKELQELNPFERESIGWHIEIHDLLNRLGEEMSRPLERADDTTLYVPCQRLADYIRQNHYDGIRYPSALNPGGSSIVFFDPEIAQVGESKLVKVTEVNFEYQVDDEPRLADRIKAASLE